MTDIGLYVSVAIAYILIGWLAGYIVRSFGMDNENQLGNALLWPIVLVVSPFIFIWLYFKSHPLAWNTVNPSQILDRTIIRLTLKKVQEDETGTLYQGYHPGLRRDNRDDVISHKYVEVQVRDEKQRRTYRIPVPQDTKTARGGVAWTFGLAEKDYKPVVQS